MKNKLLIKAHEKIYTSPITDDLYLEWVIAEQLIFSQMIKEIWYSSFHYKANILLKALLKYLHNRNLMQAIEEKHICCILPTPVLFCCTPEEKIRTKSINIS